jgi:glucuronosyltransferase
MSSHFSSFKYQLYPELERLTRERFNFKNMPSLLELEQRTKLLLLNSDHAVDYPEPLQPNMVLVGGLQITDPKELPADMKRFVESGKKGTVLMSLGTNILSNLLGNEILTSILKTFESLPDYNFVWKFESEPHELPIRPSTNVMVAKFLPQNDLLAHENLKAFITHAGGLSTQESLWYGKPMIGIPFIADQYRSIDKSVANGVGVKVDIATLNVDNFRASIVKVLEAPSYTSNAQKISKLFQDKPMKPLDTAVWWIEFVMRNPDAPIYRSPTLDLGFLASNNYDILLVCIVFLHVTVFGVRALLCKIFGKKKDAGGASGKKIKKN